MIAELQSFGLTPYFTSQLAIEEYDGSRLCRVVEVHRSIVRAWDGIVEVTLPHPMPAESNAAQLPTVGDWVVLDAACQRIERVLERSSVFQRVAAGEKAEIQLIAANIDVLFVVTSCNEEFKESRLERYLALAAEARVVPVVVLTKADLTDASDDYVQRVRQVQSGVSVVAINALDAETRTELTAWIEPQTTVALVGSSGVGKSTILNTLMQTQIAETGGIREDDKKGRHTTTHRSMKRLPGGGMLIDVPGIDEGIAVVFEDIEALARQCRFSDCRHIDEPACAVLGAIEAGTLDPRRLSNYHKLQRENERHGASLAQIRKQGREFGKIARDAAAWKKGLRG